LSQAEVLEFLENCKGDEYWTVQAIARKLNKGAGVIAINLQNLFKRFEVERITVVLPADTPYGYKKCYAYKAIK